MEKLKYFDMGADFPKIIRQIARQLENNNWGGTLS